MNAGGTLGARLTQAERRDIERAALDVFLASGKRCVKELSVVPACKDCGRVPTQYSRFADGTVQCAADDRPVCLQAKPCEVNS